MQFAKWAVMKQMKRWIKISILFFLWTFAQTVNAQITGFVIDAQTGDTIARPSLSYKGHHIAVSGDSTGYFSIERYNGWYLTVSALGYKTQRILIKENTPSKQVFKLQPDARKLGEVTVRSKRKSKYSRKDNPAVELMRRVIAAKKKTDLENYDYYQYNKYQKITLAVNDITSETMESDLFKNRDWLVNHIERCPYNDKLILPLSVDETAIQHLYRKQPKTRKDIIKGQSSTGISQLIETGDMFNTILKDFFTDIDLYDDQIRFLQYPFTSPIGKDAVDFYRFYIEDTVYVGPDRCFHLQFTPNNQQDFGFRGEIYVLADTTLHVKRCVLTLPKSSVVNFVDNLRMEQEYTRLANGEWVLTKDDMMVEMSLAKFLTKAAVIRTTRFSDYAFDELPKKLFKGKADVRYEADAKMRKEDFWNKYRTVDLTKSESSMNDFIHSMERSKGFKYILFGLKALVENFIETGSKNTKSKFDIGPVNTIISNNFVDGLRFRASGQTTAALNPHWFWKGYYAYGTKTHKSYYSSLVTYSFNKKEYQPSEFPSRTLSFETTYDVMSPSDMFLNTDKDNLFTAFRWAKVNQMYFYNRQKLKFDWETDWGFRTTVQFKTESDQPTGELSFNRLSDGEIINKIRTTEATVSLELCPGRTYVNTKQHRIPVNFDAPEFRLTHTMGFDGLFGGRYRYNYTEVSIYKRIWMKSWGRINTQIKAGAQWNKVPFPLLIMPPTNLSYTINEGKFSLMNNMEFLNDRFAMLDISWDLNGKIFNRIPLLKKLKWRECIGVKGMIGHLTDKNNPFLEENANDPDLFVFPEGANLMDKNKPYWEISVGIYNIFKFFRVDYVRRLSYTKLPTAKLQGIRVGFEFTF